MEDKGKIMIYKKEMFKRKDFSDYDKFGELLKDKKTISCNNKTYEIGEVNNMPQGKIDLLHASANMAFWLFKDFEVIVE